MERSTSDIGLEALVAPSGAVSGWAVAAGALAVVGLGAAAVIDKEQERVIAAIRKMPRFSRRHAMEVEFDEDTVEAFRRSLPPDEDGEPPVSLPWEQPWTPEERLLCVEWLEMNRRPEAPLYALLVSGEPFMNRQREYEEDRGPVHVVDHFEVFNLGVYPKKMTEVTPLVRAILAAYGQEKDADAILSEGACQLHEQKFGEGDTRDARCRAGPARCQVWLKELRSPRNLSKTAKRQLASGVALRTIGVRLERPATKAWTPEVTVVHEGEDQPRLLGPEYADSDTPHVEK